MVATEKAKQPPERRVDAYSFVWALVVREGESLMFAGNAALLAGYDKEEVAEATVLLGKLIDNGEIVI